MKLGKMLLAIKTILISILILYICFFIFAFLFSNRLMFPRPIPSYKDTNATLKLKTRDGQLITAIYLPNQTAHYVVLVSHGNGEDLGHITPFLKKFHSKGFAIFAYDYHGYGTSEGIPTEKNVYEDINTAYDYLIQTLHYKPTQIIIYGRSIGTGPSIELATHKPIAGLILESPFVSIFQVVTHFTLLPFDKFKNLNKIKKIHCPLLIIHGSQDLTVPFWHGKKLFNAANQPKTFLVMPGYGHNDAGWRTYSNYWTTIKTFIENIKN